VSLRGSTSLPLPLWEGINLEDLIGLQGLPDSYSIPGLMESALNIGMNDDVAIQLAEKFNTRFACDTYARFLFNFGVLVLGVDPGKYHTIMQHVMARTNGTLGGRLLNNKTVHLADLQYIVQEFKKICQIPDDPMEQLVMVIRAILSVWFGDTAMRLRGKMNDKSSKGAAIIVQAMVYGNLNRSSGAGVCFSRDPTTGEPGIVGQYLPNAEGDDIFISLRPPMSFPQMRVELPKVAERLEMFCEVLEKKHKEMQEIEFAVEDGVLYILQAKRSRRSPIASFVTVASMVEVGLLTEREGLMLLDPRQLPFFSQKQIDPSLKNGLNVVSSGRPGGYGIASGHAAFSPSKVHSFVAAGKQTIFCVGDLSEFAEDDLSAMVAATGVATLSGSLRSDVAVLCRGLSKPAVVGLRDISFIDEKIDDEKGSDNFIPACARVLYGSKFGVETVIHEGDIVTVDGSTGQLLTGIPSTIDPAKDKIFLRVINWTDQYRSQKVFANVDSFPDIAIAAAA